MELNPGFLHGPSINGWTYLLGCIYGWDESPQESLGEAMTLSKRTFELDPTDDPTHGGQPLTFFNGHYDTWCYLPPVSSSSITGYQRAQVSTLRERLLKLGAWVEALGAPHRCPSARFGAVAFGMVSGRASPGRSTDVTATFRQRSWLPRDAGKHIRNNTADLR